MNAQTARDLFWKHFDEYIEKMGNKFYVTHVKGGKNQAAGNINNPSPMAMQTICCEYKYRENVILVQVYINGKGELFEELFAKKEVLEKQLGYKVEWIDHGKKSASVRKYKEVFI